MYLLAWNFTPPAKDYVTKKYYFRIIIIKGPPTLDHVSCLRLLIAQTRSLTFTIKIIISEYPPGRTKIYLKTELKNLWWGLRISIFWILQKWKGSHTCFYLPLFLRVFIFVSILNSRVFYFCIIFLGILVMHASLFPPLYCWIWTKTKCNSYYEFTSINLCT